jgi:hypothetical protein
VNGRRAVAGAAACLAVIASAPAHGQGVFAVETLASPGRTVAAELVDLDGDGRSDLLTVVFTGLPPAERRELQVRFQDDAGHLAASPWRAPLPACAAAYDVADVDDRDGAELALLCAESVEVLSLSGREPVWRELPAPAATAAPVPDERGLDRLRMVRPELGAARFLVPGLATLAVLGTHGESFGMLRTGARGNYFLPPRPGPLIGENELELYFDVPRAQVIDVDGDGRADVVTASRHEVRVFLQRADGRFPTDADRVLPLALLSEEDHVRNQGGARVEARDWDGDGRADLLVSHAAGGLLRAVTRTRLHRGREGGGWNLAQPDQVFESRGGVSVDELIDLDGDGRPELVRAFLPLGVLDLAEVFLQRAIDVEASIHRAAQAGRFEESPWFRRRFAVGLDFDTMRPSGFVPTVAHDWNGDGHADLLTSGDGSGIEIWLGGPVHRFSAPSARQPLDTAGRVRAGHLDGDPLLDLVLYDPRRPDAPVRILRNLGNGGDLR